MTMILKLLDQVLYFIPRFISSMIFMLTGFPDLIIRGGITVITPFHYRSLENEYDFRTSIQLDADIINFIPDPDQFKNDITWKMLYAEKYQIHHKKIKKLMADLYGIYTVPWVLSAGSSVFLLISIDWLLTIDISEIILYYQMIILMALIYVFRKLFFKNFFKYLIFFSAFLIRKRIIGKDKKFLRFGVSD